MPIASELRSSGLSAAPYARFTAPRASAGRLKSAAHERVAAAASASPPVRAAVRTQSRRAPSPPAVSSRLLTGSTPCTAPGTLTTAEPDVRRRLAEATVSRRVDGVSRRVDAVRRDVVERREVVEAVDAIDARRASASSSASAAASMAAAARWQRRVHSARTSASGARCGTSTDWLIAHRYWSHAVASAAASAEALGNTASGVPAPWAARSRASAFCLACQRCLGGTWSFGSSTLASTGRDACRQRITSTPCSSVAG